MTTLTSLLCSGQEQAGKVTVRPEQTGGRSLVLFLALPLTPLLTRGKPSSFSVAVSPPVTGIMLPACLALGVMCATSLESPAVQDAMVLALPSVLPPPNQPSPRG